MVIFDVVSDVWITKSDSKLRVFGEAYFGFFTELLFLAKMINYLNVS